MSIRHQQLATDEFANEPRGLRRFGIAMRRRLKRLAAVHQTPPRWSVQEAFDYCQTSVGLRENPSPAWQRVRELYEQDGTPPESGWRNVEAPADQTMSGYAEFGHPYLRRQAIAQHTMLELAQLAANAFQSGSAEQAVWGSECLAYLRAQQQASGMIGDDRTTLAFLEAAFWEARTAFDRDAWEFPAEIAQDDGRAEAVRAWCRQLPHRARVLDAGCGKGRYLRVIQAERSDLRLTGLDLSPQALSATPREAERRCGSLLRIPAESGEFAAVLCVEALEHALLPVQAAQELCRVLEPNGTLLVIDKDRRYQAESHTAPWETWFSEKDLNNLFRDSCTQVECSPISHGRSARKRLFLAWQGARLGQA